MLMFGTKHVFLENVLIENGIKAPDFILKEHFTQAVYKDELVITRKHD
jgi:hypothetical protein